ncbi:glutaredoxin family protein [Marinobacter xestospongiae]|uniref:Glutaredoxin family protein n=1 Tax=Marinobacter xestospongiae TaxID=994319 RepID=A0ABU3W3M3_9GAMM|nr:glutaredoxin family protein [Marinobacter xestospongiae]MDV2080586.1 glutaredoxin family protein [Marinobacter xestospongiae]
MQRLKPILLAMLFWLMAVPAVAGDPERSEVVLFSQPYCPGCLAAKQFFAEQGVAYREFDISTSEAARDTFERLGGQGTPFLLINGRRVQGFSEPVVAPLLSEKP